MTLTRLSTYAAALSRRRALPGAVRTSGAHDGKPIVRVLRLHQGLYQAQFADGSVATLAGGAEVRLPERLADRGQKAEPAESGEPTAESGA